MKNEYDALMAFTRETQALTLVAQRLEWDQETTMPHGAAPQRAEEIAAMEAIVHGRQTAPQVADWLAKIDADNLDQAGQAQLRHIRRFHERATKVPADLAKELAHKRSTAQRIWANARAAEDVSAFLPVLGEMIDLKRQEAQALAQGGDVYDALLQDYEPGSTGEEIAQMFNALRGPLTELRAAVLAAKAPTQISGTYDVEKQMQLAKELAVVFGYDMNNGRVDKAVHPFASGAGLDVRITTRTNEDDPFNCIYSVIHETGHAAYEQNIDKAYLLTPLGNGVSMGVHESQSRIYENQLGRSRPFTQWLYGKMRDTFGDFGIPDADAFYGTVNRVNNGFIRTEADELQYNLHVMMRFDLERALMLGDLQVGDLEAAWNDRFAADFGYPVDKPSNGLLQDVHWSVGLFGYFPTYSLGNVYSGCLYQALRQAVPNLDDALAQGNTKPATDWLRDNLQTHGGLYKPRDVIKRASGLEPGPEPLLAYLKDKFGEIYGL